MSSSWIQLLHHQERLASVYESHGIICGLLCAEPDAAQQGLQQDLMQPDQALPHAYRQLLQKLIRMTAQQLDAGDYALQLALPEEEEPLAQRCHALAEWCQGFILGVHLNGKARYYQGEAKEAIQDIAQVASQLFAVDIFDEQSEHDWLEIMEFVRMAVLLIYTDRKISVRQ